MIACFTLTQTTSEVSVVAVNGKEIAVGGIRTNPCAGFALALKQEF